MGPIEAGNFPKGSPLKTVNDEYTLVEGGGYLTGVEASPRPRVLFGICDWAQPGPQQGRAEERG